MRCFIAFDVPEEVKQHLQQLQEQIRQLGIKASYNKEHHATLKFLGEISPQKAEHVKQQLQKIKSKPFTLTLNNFDFFPNENYIRVLWVGVEPEGEVNKLQKDVDEALQQFPKEKNYKTHLTLARIKFIEDKEQFKQQLQRIEVKKLQFTVDKFKLKQSTLTPEGPVYSDLAHYP